MKYIRSTKSIDSQTTVVICQGEMDTLAVEELRQAVDPLLADATTHLILDLAAVEYVSSSVLSFLMATQGKAREKGGKVSLVGASDLVRQVFEMASLDGLFSFSGALEDLGIVQAPSAPAKGREKAAKKEKGVSAKPSLNRSERPAVAPVEPEARPAANAVEETAPSRREPRTSARAQPEPANGQEERAAREVEKLHPAQEQGSWKDYGVWIGIAAAVVVSVVVSLYLYLAQP